jgi:hypothetical protein
MALMPVDEKCAVVGYWSKGVYKVTVDGEEDVNKEELAKHGIADVVMDRYKRYVFTRPDSYKVIWTKNWKKFVEIGKLKNMSDSKARHLKISRSRTFIAVRGQNQKMYVYKSTREGIVPFKKLMIDPFHGKISDFCFTQDEKLIVLTPQGTIFYDDFSANDDSSVGKIELFNPNKKTPMQYYCIDFSYKAGVFFVGKSEMVPGAQKVYKSMVNCYSLNQDGRSVRSITQFEFDDFKSKFLLTL